MSENNFRCGEHTQAIKDLQSGGDKFDAKLDSLEGKVNELGLKLHNMRWWIMCSALAGAGINLYGADTASVVIATLKDFISLASANL